MVPRRRNHRRPLHVFTPVLDSRSSSSITRWISTTRAKRTHEERGRKNRKSFIPRRRSRFIDYSFELFTPVSARLPRAEKKRLRSSLF